MARPSKPADYGVEAGTILLGKYRVDAILGHGGMGVVAQATHLQLEERVAIKFLRDDVTLDEETMRRFLREAQNAVKLKSEHVARVTDVGTFESGVPYMVMEFLEGIDLGQMLQDSTRINPRLAVDLLLQACVALAEAHSLGIVHRDIKPGNLFVTWRADGSALLKILDFGISKAPIGADMNLTQTQSLLGTPAYMSPEQMRSARSVDPRSDIWSLGTVLYEIIQGRRPFEAESFSEMCVKVAVDPPAPLTVPYPAGLEKVILRALEKNPDERYQNIAEMARDLAPFAHDKNSAMVAVERMARMLGRSRAQHDRNEHSSPEAVPRGMMRDVKSAPVMLPKGSKDEARLNIGDVTDPQHHILTDHEATSITTLDPSDVGTKTTITALADQEITGDSGHETVEEDVSSWTPQPQPIAAPAGTTDPSMPPVELPPEIMAVAKGKLGPAARKAQNATQPMPPGKAAAKIVRPLPGLPAKKASVPNVPPVGAASGSGGPASKEPPPVIVLGQPGPTQGPTGAQGQPVGFTLPGLFPAAIRSIDQQRPMAVDPRAQAAARGSLLGPAPTIPSAPQTAIVSARTSVNVDLRGSRRVIWVVLMLALATGVGVGVYYGMSGSGSAPAKPPVVDPAPSLPPPPATTTDTTQPPPTDLKPGATIAPPGTAPAAGSDVARPPVPPPPIEIHKPDTGGTAIKAVDHGKTGGGKTGGGKTGGGKTGGGKVKPGGDHGDHGGGEVKPGGGKPPAGAGSAAKHEDDIFKQRDPTKPK